MQNLTVSHICLHFGEEPPISGTKGSGTIFFAYCNLKCIFCQNYQISQQPDKALLKTFSPRELAEEMLKLQSQKAHNINLVSPTHFSLPIIESLKIAKEIGLKIPVVYNSNGYDKVENLKLFAGLIDIYLPDLKYADNEKALEYSKAPGYFEVAQNAIKEMYKQVGNLVLDDTGIAKKGLIVRHLVLPNNLANTKECLDFLANISTDLCISLMAQYSPQFKAKDYPELNRTLTEKEYDEVVDYAENLGLENVFIQELTSHESYLPDFNAAEPFKS